MRTPLADGRKSQVEGSVRRNVYDQCQCDRTLDSEWGSFLRARAALAGEAATGIYEVTTAALDGPAQDQDRDEGHGQPAGARGTGNPAA